jgi:high-affinity Fe2+/Pb2+ permease
MQRGQKYAGAFLTQIGGLSQLILIIDAFEGAFLQDSQTMITTWTNGWYQTRANKWMSKHMSSEKPKPGMQAQGAYEVLTGIRQGGTSLSAGQYATL